MVLRKWQVYITVVTLVSGIWLAVILKGYDRSPQSKPENRNADLIALIDNLEEEASQFEQELESLRKEIDDLQRSQSSGQAQLKTLHSELDNLRHQGGLLPVAGPGVIIVLDDDKDVAQAVKKGNPTQYNPENFIIHDKDILYLTNELRAAGAEAISINEQRVTGFTDIRCVGTLILVNSTRLAPPYEIKAIGQPRELEAAVLAGEEFPYLKGKGFPVKLSRDQKIELLPYKGGYSFVYSRTPTDEGKEAEATGGDS